MLIIDFAYSWADSWVGKIEEGSSCYKWLTILASLGMYILSLTTIILMFVFYGKPRDGAEAAGTNCGQNKALVAVNLVLAIAITMVALSGRVQEAVPNSGLLQAGVVVSYVTYYTWSAVSENDQVRVHTHTHTHKPKPLPHRHFVSSRSAAPLAPPRDGCSTGVRGTTINQLPSEVGSKLAASANLC